MAEDKLSTTTAINYKADGTVDIILTYAGKLIPCDERMPHILSTNISDVVGRINGVDINEGELYAIAECYPEWIQMVVDNNGNLVLIVANSNETHYYVNGNEGSLWWDDTV